MSFWVSLAGLISVLKRCRFGVTGKFSGLPPEAGRPLYLLGIGCPIFIRAPATRCRKCNGSKTSVPGILQVLLLQVFFRYFVPSSNFILVSFPTKNLKQVLHLCYPFTWSLVLFVTWSVYLLSFWSFFVGYDWRFSKKIYSDCSSCIHFPFAKILQQNEIGKIFAIKEVMARHIYSFWQVYAADV